MVGNQRENLYGLLTSGPEGKHLRATPAPDVGATCIVENV